jgi:hypothetical protein
VRAGATSEAARGSAQGELESHGGHEPTSASVIGLLCEAVRASDWEAATVPSKSGEEPVESPDSEGLYKRMKRLGIE